MCMYVKLTQEGRPDITPLRPKPHRYVDRQVVGIYPPKNFSLLTPPLLSFTYRLAVAMFVLSLSVVGWGIVAMAGQGLSMLLQKL